MQLEVGKIYEGKVTGITKFGAFVELDSKTTGMVHISEVANTFVNEIKDHLTEGQTVKVKVLAVGEDGKISLSIKKALPPVPRKPRPVQAGTTQDRKPMQGGAKPFAPRTGAPRPQNGRQQNNRYQANTEKSGDASFEDMLSKFKQTSEEKFSDLKRVIDGKRKGGSRRSK